MSARSVTTSLGAAALTVFVGLGTTGPAAAASAVSDLYSGKAVMDFCINAQKIIANTSLTAFNINHSSLPSFTFSSSAPYEGPNLSAYNGKETPGSNLALTMQQWVNYATIPTSGWQFPQIISCKMKDAEAIQFHFGPTAAGNQESCVQVNQDTVARVYANLTSFERRLVRYQQNSIVYDPDILVEAGPTWLGGLPNLTPTTIYLGNDGQLHIQSKAINIERTNPSPAATPDKKGTYYCHLPSPEYVRNVVLGQYPACTSNSFPDVCFLP